MCVEHALLLKTGHHLDTTLKSARQLSQANPKGESDCCPQPIW